VNPKTERLAIFGGLVEVDHQLAELKGGVARTNAILAKTRSAGLFFDRYCVLGDSAVDAKQFDGLRVRIVGNQLITNAVDGAAVARAKVDELLDAVAGPNEGKVLVMNKAVRRGLKDALLAEAGGSGLVDVNGSLTSYDGAKIEVLDEDGDETPILDFNETCGESNDCTSMYCIRPGQDPEGEWVQGLMGNKMIDHKQLGQVGTKVQDLVEMLGGLGIFHGRAAARLQGIKRA
jgi:hypothetical protein